MPSLSPRQARPDQTPPGSTSSHGISGWAIFVIVVVLLFALAGAGWFFWMRYRRSSRSMSTPAYPSPAPGGVVGFLQTQYKKLRGVGNRRFASGAGYEGRGSGYHQTGSGLDDHGGAGAGGSNRGRHMSLDPDEAWDTRVGNEAEYGPYEEQELGLRAPSSYTGGGYAGTAGLSLGAGATSYEEERGRSRSRMRDELDERYDEEMGRGRSGGGDGGGRKGRQDPFADEYAAPSLRGVSPRPLETDVGRQGGQRQGPEDSPTERRSMFRENV